MCTLASCGPVKGPSLRRADSCGISSGFLLLLQTWSQRQAWPLWKSIVKSNSPHLASLPGSCDKSPAGHGDIWIPSFVVELLFLIGRGLVPCMLCEQFLVPPRHCFMSAMRRNLFKSALNCVSELFCLSVFFFFFFLPNKKSPSG